MRITGPIAAIACAATLAGWWIDRPMFFAAWLVAAWFSLGLVLGALAHGLIHRVTGGAWGEAIRPAVHALAGRLRWMPLAFVPAALGATVLYPWLRDAAWDQGLARPGFIHAWLAPGFVAMRVVVYLVAGAWFARASKRQRSSGSAARALVVYAVLVSLAAVDLVMSLTPTWSSSVFGWLQAAGQLLGGAALCTWLAARSGHEPPVSRGQPPVWRDLGNLLLAFVMVQAYLAFMQFLIVWAENLPREISWFVPRLQTGWAGVGIALVLCQFALPLLMLLQRRIKDDPRRLAFVAAWILAAQALDAAWTIVPSVEAHSLHGWWLLPLAFVGSGLALFGRLLFESLPSRLEQRHAG